MSMRPPAAPQSSAAVACDADCPLTAAGGWTRREFLSQSLLAAAALALAACAGGDAGGAITGPSVSSSVKVTDYASLSSVGGVAVVNHNGTPVAIVHEAGDQFIALSLVCPHQGATVGTSSNGFTCPRHGARFDLNGTWIGGQPTSNMRRVATSYDASTGTLTFL